jgi:hypothetical protein
MKREGRQRVNSESTADSLEEKVLTSNQGSNVSN